MPKTMMLVIVSLNSTVDQMFNNGAGHLEQLPHTGAATSVYHWYDCVAPMAAIFFWPPKVSTQGSCPGQPVLVTPLQRIQSCSLRTSVNWTQCSKLPDHLGNRIRHLEVAKPSMKVNDSFVLLLRLQIQALQGWIYMNAFWDTYLLHLKMALNDLKIIFYDEIITNVLQQLFLLLKSSWDILSSVSFSQSVLLLGQ